ncbi:LysR family transcriptional regulator [Rhizobium leguminosarum]|uniref:LysR family transcriptional regulator n=1 Tax=Rhizobium leguminosarum TaxID=384 RepID=UPI001CDB9282|nr:LysR family transcriptional regulator [Rhizobium leguminosarum]
MRYYPCHGYEAHRSQPPRQLEALLVERNVTRAAARLHMSQPALSAQLNRLRDLFKDPLLVPAHRGMVPTAKALELIGPLRASLDQLRGTLQSHDSFSPATAKLTISIACTDYVETVVVAPLIAALRGKLRRYAWRCTAFRRQG